MKTDNEDKVLYEITERMIQGLSQERLERDLSKDEIFEVLNKTCWQFDGLFSEAIDEVDTMTGLWEEAIPAKDAEKENPRYEVHWKNENAYVNEFSLICAFKEEEDARYFTRERYDAPCEEYKIEKVEGNRHTLLVHHKNAFPELGFTPIHMDVHDEPKSVRNAEQNF